MEPIVYIASHIEPVHTGGEQYNLHLIAAAEQAGVKVVRKMLSDNPVHQWLNRRRGLWRLSRLFAFLWLHLKIYRHRHEILLFDAWLAPLLWPGIGWVRGHYLVMVHHLCADLRHSDWRRMREGFCEARLLRGAARVLTVSQSSRRQVEAKAANAVTDVINTAFEPVEGVTHGGGDVLRILYVGHITRAKGVPDLTEAVAALPRARSWRLDLVGRNTVEPDTTAQIHTICQQADIHDRVHLHGRLDDDALLEMYLSADIFVLPSHWEGYGIVLLEAMSHGLAVIATTAGAIPEVVTDGETGLLVAPGDIVALRKAIASLMDDKRLRSRLAAQGQKFARRHPDWKAMEKQSVLWWKSMASGVEFTSHRQLPLIKRFPLIKQSLLRLLMRRMAGNRKRTAPQHIRTIALWQFGGIGDMLLATPVIRAMETAYPDATIHLWCSNPAFAGFLRRFPSIESIHAFPVYDFDSRTLMHGSTRKRIVRLSHTMAEQHPDILVNLHVPALLDWWAVEWWLTKRLHTPYALGFHPHGLKQRSICDVSLPTLPRDRMHYTQLYRKLLTAAVIDCGVRTEFPLSDTDRGKALRLLAERTTAKNRWICMHIGGGRLSLENKMWPLECFALLAERLIGEGFTPVLIGVQSERDMGDKLCSMVDGCIDLIGHTEVEEMAALIEQSNGFIGHDSGPFHIAVAVGTPAVAICGRPDAEPEYLQYDLASVHVLTADAPDLIAVDAVFDAAMQAFGATEI